MKSMEELINAKYGKTNHYRVPDGYFDNLSAQVMERLPEKKQPLVDGGFRKFIRPMLYAACTIAAVFTVISLVNQNETHNDPIEATTVADANSAINETYSDAIADYAMMDNIDIYACLESETN